MKKENKSTVIRREACPACRSKGRDRSGDNLAVYLNADGEESSYCFSCNYVKASADFKKESFKDRYEYEIIMAGHFDIDFWNNLVKQTGGDPKGWRGLTKETCKKFGVRHRYNEQGQVTHQIYPITKNEELVGIKYRTVDKKWNNRGEAGKEVDLFGRISFKSNYSKRVIIASGEIEVLSIYQAISPYFESKGWELPVIVSSVAGEGALSQFRNHYHWLDKFDRIYICPDQDEPGIQYLHKLAQALPRNKLFVMSLPTKDSNELLEQGKPEVILDSYFKASSYTPSGVIGSDQLDQALIASLSSVKIPLPPFLIKLSDMTRGGFKVPSMVNIVGPTGIGKGHPDHTRILTTEGWTSMKDITLNTKVITPEGKESKVTGIYPQPIKPVYNITFEDGRSTECCEDHLWQVCVKNEDKVIDTKEILKLFQDKEEISIPLVNFENSSYFNRSPFHKISPYERGVSKFCNFDIDSWPVSDLEDFIKGFISDREYSLSVNNELQLTFKDKNHLTFIRNIFYRLGGKARISPEGDTLFIVYRSLSNIISDYMNEKDFNKLKIQNIDYISDMTTTCIMIDDPKHLYIVDDYIVTHNTTYVNELIFFWIFNAPYKIGILSLELDREEYSNVLASRFLNVKLNLLPEEESLAIVQNEENQKALKTLWMDEEDSPRFYLMEERDGKLENIKNLIEQLIIACDCKMIILDPLQDLFAGLNVSEQEEFSAWIKITMKAYKVCFICINHTRKSSGPMDLEYTEQEVKGSGTIIQSSSYNILLNREKDPSKSLTENQQFVLRNTMTHRLTKNRATGITGNAGDLFYDNNMHVLFDIDEYKSFNPEIFETPEESTTY